MRPPESFIGQPVRSLQTMLRVLAQDDTSLPAVIPDGIYGPSTMNAISAFQRKYGLPATGITNQETWDLIVSQYDEAIVRIDKAQPIEIILDPGEEFAPGDSSPYIYLAQGMLTQLSNDHPTIDPTGLSGIMDLTTVSATTAFQRLAGLPETGSIDRITWKNLVLHYTLNAHHTVTQRR